MLDWDFLLDKMIDLFELRDVLNANSASFYSFETLLFENGMKSL